MNTPGGPPCSCRRPPFDYSTSGLSSSACGTTSLLDTRMASRPSGTRGRSMCLA